MRKLITLLLLLAIPAFGQDYVKIRLTDAATNASSSYSTTSAAIYGFVDFLYINVSNQGSYKAGISLVTNLRPRGDGIFKLNGTHNTSNSYITFDGNYQLRYETNDNWIISDVDNGAFAGPSWTSEVAGVINTDYYPYVCSSGSMRVAATTIDVDVDIYPIGYPYYTADVALFSKDDITDGGQYFPRLNAHSYGGAIIGDKNGSNIVTRLPMAGNRLVLSAYDSINSNVDVDAYLIIVK